MAGCCSKLFEYIAVFIFWHLLSAGLVIMLVRIIEGFLALLFLYPHFFMEHLKIARFALNPFGKKLIYTKETYKPARRWPIIECISILIWIPIILAVSAIQFVGSLLAALLTCGHMSKYWR